MQKAMKKLFSTKILLTCIPFELNFHCKVSFRTAIFLYGYGQAKERITKGYKEGSNSRKEGGKTELGKMGGRGERRDKIYYKI